VLQRGVGLEALRERDHPEVVDPVEAEVEARQRRVLAEQLADARCACTAQRRAGVKSKRRTREGHAQR
jgi:hypothetical protein